MKWERRLSVSWVRGNRGDEMKRIKISLLDLSSRGRMLRMEEFVGQVFTVDAHKKKKKNITCCKTYVVFIDWSC